MLLWIRTIFLSAVLSFSCTFAPPTFAAPPEASPWQYRICQTSVMPLTLKRECEIWELGAWASGLQCLNREDPEPWADESTLDAKAVAWASSYNTSVAKTRNWLGVDERNDDNYGCWTGTAEYLYGIETTNINTYTMGTGGKLTGRRERSVACPSGTSYNNGICVRPAGGVDPYRNNCDSGCNGPNPIHTYTGAKLHAEVDYSGAGPIPLRFERFFTSLNIWDRSGFGSNWRHTYSRRIVYVSTASVTAATVYRENGNRYYFHQAVQGNQTVWLSDDPDVTDKLSLVTRNGVPQWEYRNLDDQVEIYDFISGQLLSITNRDGFSLVLSYDVQGRLAVVADPFGRQLRLTYNQYSPARNLIASMEIVASGRPSESTRFRYEYVNSARSGDAVYMISSVVYPDLTSETDTDNPRKQYRLFRKSCG